MRADDYIQWKAALTQLSAAQRKEAALLLKQLGPTVPDEDNDWLLTALLEELRRRGLVLKASQYQVRKLAPQWPAVSKQIRALLLAGSSQPLSEVQVIQLGRLVVQVYLDRLKAPPTLANCLRLIHWLPVLFDRAYPDYLHNKLLFILLTQATHVDNPDDLE